MKVDKSKSKQLTGRLLKAQVVAAIVVATVLVSVGTRRVDSQIRATDLADPVQAAAALSFNPFAAGQADDGRQMTAGDGQLAQPAARQRPAQAESSAARQYVSITDDASVAKPAVEAASNTAPAAVPAEQAVEHKAPTGTSASTSASTSTGTSAKIPLAKVTAKAGAGSPVKLVELGPLALAQPTAETTRQPGNTKSAGSDKTAKPAIKSKGGKSFMSGGWRSIALIGGGIGAAAAIAVPVAMSSGGGGSGRGQRTVSAPAP